MKTSGDEESFLRLPQVLERCGIKKTTLYKCIKQGTFPRQVKVNSRISVWPKSLIDSWIFATVAANRCAVVRP